MQMIFHILIFAAAIAALWFFAGLIVSSVDSIAKRFNNSSFIVAFFLLGFMTSLSETSVAVNALIEKVPQISVGNLAGASIVLLLFIVPLLAVASGQVRVNKLFKPWELAVLFGVIALPSLFLFDGVVVPEEGMATLVFLVVVFWFVRKGASKKDVHAVEHLQLSKFPFFEIGKIIVSAVVIFFAGRLLVSEAVYFAEVLDTPRSVIGIVLLSIGTNIPEIAVALRSVLAKKLEVALGNYLGSAAMNTFIFAVVSLASGRFLVESSGFVITFLVSIVGFALLYLFLRTKDTLARWEGMVLLAVYVVFIVLQIRALP